MRDLGFYEFFCGGGMARTGLGPGWRCLLANDIDPKKAEAYARNFGAAEIVRRDVAALTTADLPGHADLAWASFPCQDLSLAGDGRGLGEAGGERSRSGAFWPFWRLMRSLRAEGRAPPVVALENVVGLLTSRGGADLENLLAALQADGRRVALLQIDARWFLPQSRPRLFVLALDRAVAIPPDLLGAPDPDFHPPALAAALARLPPGLRRGLVSLRLPGPAAAPPTLAALLEAEAPTELWDPPETTQRLLASMSPWNREKLEAARRAGVGVGALYRRTRRTPEGARVVRAEARFDGIAGCLRTPAGGSSRQKLLIIGKGGERSRLVTAREAARLMGLPDSYRLPARYGDAYHLLGDGVCPPVVRHLAAEAIEPLLLGRSRRAAA